MCVWYAMVCVDSMVAEGRMDERTARVVLDTFDETVADDFLTQVSQYDQSDMHVTVGIMTTALHHSTLCTMLYYTITLHELHHTPLHYTTLHCYSLTWCDYSNCCRFTSLFFHYHSLTHSLLFYHCINVSMCVGGGAQL
jgi:hypothetical protein